MDERTKQLEHSSIPKLLVRLSLPAMTGMMVEAMYNVVGRMFIGRAQVGMAGPAGLAGMTICFPFMMVMMAFTLLISVGGAARISMALGKGDKDAAESIVATGALLAVCFGILYMTVGLIFLDQILIFFGADYVTLPYARAYMRVILLGAVPNMFAFALNRYILAQGNAIFAMKSLLVSCGLNVILTPLFIYAFEWGVEGAAIATSISWTVKAVWVALFYVRKQGSLRLKIRGVVVRASVVLSILSIGIAPFSLQLTNSLTNSILNNALRVHGGAMAISAMGAIVSVMQFFQMPLFGLNHGNQPIVGYNYGAQNYSRVRQAFRLTLISGTAISVIGFILIMSIPHALIGLFSADPEVLDIGERSIRIFLMALPAFGIIVNGQNFFSVTGRPHIAMTITLGRQALLISGLLILPRFFALDGVFASAPFADIISFAVAAIFVAFEWRRLKRIDPTV